METMMDDKSSIYNIHLCRICQNSTELDLVATSDTSESPDGKSCLETLKYIFFEIVWVEDCLLSLVCRTCLKRIYETAQFKQLCLESQTRREEFNSKYIELVNESISSSNTVTLQRNSQLVKIPESEAQFEEVILPCNNEQIFIKTEKIDEENEQSESSQISLKKPAPNRKRKLDNTSLVIGDSTATKLTKIGDVTNDSMRMDNENSLLPKKSRDIYEKEYANFEKWSKENAFVSISENILISYFKIQSTTKKSSTLWSIYSMLRSCLNIYKNVDISKYSKLQAFLKGLSEGYEPKKSKTIEIEDIERFMHEADDNSYLAIKAVLIMGYNGACRREELAKISIDDIEYKSDVIFVSIRKTKTYVPRLFAITETLWIDLIKKYVDLRPKNISHRRFFITYRNGYCIASPIGINTIGKIPKIIATFLQLPNPELFTGHCFRRSNVSSLTHRARHLVTVNRHGGGKSSAAAEAEDIAKKAKKKQVEIQPSSSAFESLGELQ